MCNVWCMRIGGAYSVNTWMRIGRSWGGGRGRKGVSAVSIFWNREGMPGKMQSFPSSRTTGLIDGCVERLRLIVEIKIKRTTQRSLPTKMTSA